MMESEEEWSNVKAELKVGESNYGLVRSTNLKWKAGKHGRLSAECGHRFLINMVQPANDGSSGILSTLSTFRTLSKFSNIKVGLPR